MASQNMEDLRFEMRWIPQKKPKVVFDVIQTLIETPIPQNQNTWLSLITWNQQELEPKT